MRTTRLVRVTKTSEVSLLGSSDQRNMNSIRRVSRGDASLCAMFAQPVLDSNEETLSWYTDMPGSISSYADLDALQQKFLEDAWSEVCSRLVASRRYLETADRIILENVIQIPSFNSLYLVGRELVVTEWSSVKVGYRPRNKNIGIDFDSGSSRNALQETSNLSSDDPASEFLLDITDQPATEPILDVSFKDKGKEEKFFRSDSLDHDEAGVEEHYKYGVLYSLWFWFVLLIVLSVLNWFLLIDACGVSGIQFLNFCD